MDRSRAHALAGAVLHFRQICFEVWSSNVGLGLLEAYYRSDDTVTVREMAERLHMSEDTARRELTRLVDRGLVTCENHGRLKCYRAQKAPAEEHVRRLDEYLTAELLPFWTKS